MSLNLGSTVLSECYLRSFRKGVNSLGSTFSLTPPISVEDVMLLTIKR